MMHFTVRLPNPSSHLFSVELRFTGNNKERVLTLPNWIRGSYMIRDFSRNIISIHAHNDDESIPLSRLDKSNWVLAACNGDVVISYDVYAFDLSVRSAHMDNTHAFFNGTSLYLAVEDLKSNAVMIDIINPQIALTSEWTVKTTLSPQKVDAQGFGLFNAIDYEDAIDHPVEISRSHDLAFNVNGVPHLLHFTGDYPDQLDDRRLAVDLKRICLEQAALFQDEIPFSSYRFLTMVAANSYGGLEHKSSTSLVCMPEDLPSLFAYDEKNYQKFLGLCSHEYFHSWNVKRITPEQFSKSDLQNEAYSTLLWAFEGITSYYDDLAMLRCGCLTLEEYLGLFAQTLTRLQRAKGRFRQTVTNSSFDAWNKFYKQDENALNSIVSYYTKGAVIALGLDMEIRRQTENRLSLDDVMRGLWEKFGKHDIGIREAEFESFIQAETSLELSEFFDSVLRSTDELPIKKWLEYIGVGLLLRPEFNTKDTGGFSESATVDPAKSITLTLGCRLKPESTDVAFVYNDSPAEQAGISPGDQIISINHQKITAANFQKVIDTLSPEYPALIHIFRRERLYQFQITPDHQEPNTCDLFLISENQLTEAQLVNRNNWMTSNQLDA